jgi:hypothetical protein
MGLMSGLAAFPQMVSEENNIDIWNKIATNDHDTTKDKTLGGKIIVITRIIKDVH